MFPNLKAEMARHGIVAKDIAETLELSVERTRDRLSGRTKLDVMEAEKIRDKHFPNMTIDYLFKMRG